MPHYVPNEYSNLFGCHIFTKQISEYIRTPPASALILPLNKFLC